MSAFDPNWAVAVTTILAAGVAIIGIIFAWRAQGQATAKAIYRDYLKLAFENPELANPSESGLNVSSLVASPPSASSDKERWTKYERYRWFVAFMLNACDEIASSQRARVFWRNRALWRKAISGDLQFHNEYLMSAAFREDGGWRLYSCHLKDIWESGA
jgi:hypothetical protein